MYITMMGEKLYYGSKTIFLKERIINKQEYINKQKVVKFTEYSPEGQCFPYFGKIII